MMKSIEKAKKAINPMAFLHTGGAIWLYGAGNLQMVFSSYYMQPVDVSVELFNQCESSDADKKMSNPPIVVYDREVDMFIGGEFSCKATCKVKVYDAEIQSFGNPRRRHWSATEAKESWPLVQPP